MTNGLWQTKIWPNHGSQIVLEQDLAVEHFLSVNLGTASHRVLMTCLSLQKLFNVPTHHGPRHILKSKDLIQSSKSLFHLCKTMGPSTAFGLCITPVAAQVSFVLYQPGAVLANTALSLDCVNSLRFHSSPVKSRCCGFSSWLPLPSSFSFSISRLLLSNFTTWFENLCLSL